MKVGPDGVAEGMLLRIVPWLWGLPPDDRGYYPLFSECCELDIPFCTQVGHSGPLKESEPGRLYRIWIASLWSFLTSVFSVVTSARRG